MKIQLVFYFLLGVSLWGNAQNFPKNYFQKPLDIPLYLSGNFGELRSNHYHSGIDIKTEGKEGYKVYATADGFVSRVKVSPYGYGNAIYISHPNGYTTVYAHLQKFAPKIAKVVRGFQYKIHSFEIDKTLPINKIKVKKGEVIALSGNSGSSGGPHLHFEIRETKSEFPTNPLLYGFPIKDTVQPIIRMLYLYDFRTDSRIAYKLVKDGEVYRIENNEIPIVRGKFGIALDMRDYMSETHNYYGIYKLRMYVDDMLQHSFTLNKFSFSESRYINAHIDYELAKKQRRRIHKLFHEPNQKESFATMMNKGILFTDTKSHDVYIEVADAYGNQVGLKFKLQSQPIAYSESVKNMWYFQNQNTIKQKDFFVEIPAMSLYRNIEKPQLEKRKCPRDSYAPLYHFLDETVPLHKKMRVGVRPKNLPNSLKNKAFLARKNKNNYSFVGKRWQGDYLVGKTNVVGDFTVLVDNVAPKIDLWRGHSFKKTGKLRYKITDNLSGIDSFRGLIDGKWVLFEYDPKKRMIWHTLTSKRIKKGVKHHLVLEVTDACGNKAVRTADFKW
ncbi:MAG: M23 family metallopeptidase [Flavobacteriaceae bacterium]|nr:M23 family metallopeptidase [Flavobacteriaceae bacterium]